jgi:hypothetical protein
MNEQEFASIHGGMIQQPVPADAHAAIGMTEAGPDSVLAQKSRADFKAFLEWNREHRQQILAPAITILVKWFVAGVTFTRDHPMYRSSVLPSPVYDNAPAELDMALENAQGKLTLNILEWKQIPARLMAEILMVSSAQPLQGKVELKPTFSFRPKGPSMRPVYDTQDKPAQERGEIIANNWYELTAWRLLEYITRKSEKVIRANYARSQVGAVERAIDTEQRLRNMGYETPALIEYYACEQYRNYSDAADIMRNLGVVKSPDAIRKNHSRIKAKLAKTGGKS